MDVSSDSRWQTAAEGRPASSNNDVSNTSSLHPNLALKDGNHTLLQIAPAYIKAIMTPEDKSFPRLECPTPEGDRYDYLRSNTPTVLDSDMWITYLFALDLYQCVDILPRLLGSIVETMLFLGPGNCALSVVEGRSDDGTYEVLKLLGEAIGTIGAQYFLTTNEVDPTAEGVGRIKALAELRNQALWPLRDHREEFSVNSTVVFLNDVAICMEDILELIHQRLYQNADMTCAMDWTYVGHDPTFYDVWIARGMNGDTFFNIPEDGNWNSAWNLFWNNPDAQKSLYAKRPFQVFSCWNGAVAFTAQPLLEQKIKFRSAYEDECPQGEPKIFCKEMWNLGYGKVAVVPSINLEYSDEAAKKIKSAKGYVSKWVDGQADSAQIQWEQSPPPLVRCIPSYEHQTWVPWNESLTEVDYALR